MWFTYVLESKQNHSWYIGCSNDLVRRIRLHNDGVVVSTKKIKPLKLIYYEACMNRTDAFRRERYLKSGYGRKFLKSRLKMFITRNVK